MCRHERLMCAAFFLPLADSTPHQQPSKFQKKLKIKFQKNTPFLFSFALSFFYLCIFLSLHLSIFLSSYLSPSSTMGRCRGGCWFLVPTVTISDFLWIW